MIMGSLVCFTKRQIDLVKTHILKQNNYISIIMNLHNLIIRWHYILNKLFTYDTHDNRCYENII